MNRKFVTIICLVILTAIAVQVNGGESEERLTVTHPLAFVVPRGFPKPQYNFENNPLTKEGFELGRKLFYEGRLSKDTNFACSSCHQQFASFANYDHDFSHGFNNQFTTRNAPSLANLAWQKEFQWDGGVNNLEVQPLAPLTAPNEMAEDLNNVIRKLNADETYRRMFRAAFGSSEINSQKMLKALAQFTVMLVSANSKYDRVKNGIDSFSNQEKSGYAVFQARCASCHAEPFFTDFSYRNNGLSLHPTLKDYGRMRITNKAEDSIKFRVPSLRNVAITFSYMHDGRFYTLDQVLNHYATGIKQSATLDPLLKNGILLNASEKTSIKAFLKTLTDSSFISDPRFALPR